MTDTEEDQLPEHTPTPKNPRLPLDGWFCNGISDNESERETCQFCEKAQIRYVHRMRHEAWPQELRCGCICAGYMEGNYRTAKRRERDLKNALSRAETAKKKAERAAMDAEWRELPAAELKSVEALEDRARLTACNGIVWLVSKKDNLYLPLSSRKGDGVCTVYRHKNCAGFGFVIKNESTGQAKFSSKVFATEAEARDAAAIEIAPIIEETERAIEKLSSALFL